MSLQHQQENFMMTITHELKTPIAITKLNLETLQKHQLDESTRQKLIQMTLEETNRLNNLASNILVSSQLEAGKYQMSKEELNFSDLVKSCVSNFQSRFPERTLNTEITPELEISGDPLLLQILVNNLLENAIKYSPNKTTVTCRLKKENNKIIFQVIDEGHSIPDIEKKKIFEKFYRIGSEQTRSAKGSGLGLYLCKKIAADHNASIGVKDNHPSGSNFTVSFGQ
jgi:two-component system sensor histidine kinase CiaH